MDFLKPLHVWPYLKPILSGRLRKYRGISVDLIGKAMAINILNSIKGLEILHWDGFYDQLN